jgi:hypothetical protein
MCHVKARADILNTGCCNGSPGYVKQSTTIYWLSSWNQNRKKNFLRFPCYYSAPYKNYLNKNSTFRRSITIHHFRIYWINSYNTWLHFTIPCNTYALIFLVLARSHVLSPPSVVASSDPVLWTDPLTTTDHTHSTNLLPTLLWTTSFSNTLQLLESSYGILCHLQPSSSDYSAGILTRNCLSLMSVPGH